MRVVTALRRGWGKASREARIAIVVVSVLVGINLLAVALDAVAPGNPTGPVSSSHTTGPLGAAAYAELLADAGHPVAQAAEDPADASLDPAATAILLDPVDVDDSNARALGSFVAAGGRLVVGSGEQTEWLSEALVSPPARTSGGPVLSTPILPVPEVASIDRVRAAGDASWSSPGDAVPVLGDPSSELMLVATVGRGRIVLLADSSPVQNRLLAAEDNAAMGVAVAGDPARPVVFLETFHGYRRAGGLNAIPARWRWATAGGLVAALVWMWARGRRLGPPDAGTRPPAPPRRAFVDAMAVNLARTRRRADAIEPLRDAARRRLVAIAGLHPDESADELRAAAARAGLDDRDIRAMLGEIRGDDDVVAAGRALARLMGGPQWP